MKKQDLMVCLVALASVLCFFAGCRQGGLPGLVPGKGQVFYNGQPLAGASVTLTPVTPASTQRGAFGITDDTGHFVLMTLNPNDGVAPGDYIVTVSKMKSQQPKSDEEAMRKFLHGEGPPPAEGPAVFEHEIPPGYASTETSGLKYTIGPKGDRNIVIELKD